MKLINVEFQITAPDAVDHEALALIIAHTVTATVDELNGDDGDVIVHSAFVREREVA